MFFDEELPRIYPDWKKRLVYSKIENALDELFDFVKVMKRDGCIYKTIYGNPEKVEYTLRLVLDACLNSDYIVRRMDYIKPIEPEKKKLIK